MNTILVVDDDPHIVRALAITLKGQGYTVVTATDGQSALHSAAQRPISVMILDLGLPDMDGKTVISALREWSSVPILVLSARHGSSDKVEALDAGADDYITKPFGLDELLARLRALLRRRNDPSEEVTLVTTSSFTVDLDKRQITKSGRGCSNDPDGVEHSGHPAQESGQAHYPAAAPHRGVGARLRKGSELPPRLYGAAPAQARDRAGQPAASDHRAGHGLQVRSVAGLSRSRFVP